MAHLVWLFILVVARDSYKCHVVYMVYFTHASTYYIDIFLYHAFFSVEHFCMLARNLDNIIIITSGLCCLCAHIMAEHHQTV